MIAWIAAVITQRSAVRPQEYKASARGSHQRPESQLGRSRPPIRVITGPMLVIILAGMRTFRRLRLGH
jgi:hypothetical protein